MSSTMLPKILIELLGVWLPNKGAELMLHTVRQELNKRLKSVSFAIDSKEPFLSRTRFNMLQKRKSSFPFHEYLFPNQFDRWGIVNDSQITHYIDISGFAYGDSWGYKKARRRLGKKVKKGTPYYLLPQAFGPFTDQKLRSEMIRIGKSAKMLCARDNVSLEHLKELGLDNARLFPDITFALETTGFDQSTMGCSKYGCLIINNKLISSGNMNSKEVIELFHKAGEIMCEKNISPKVLLHEPQEDKALADELASRLNCPIIELEDAREIKSFISNSYITITARFHGLVSALSTGTPVMAIGWSHKYQELLQDFNAKNLMFEGDHSVFLENLRGLLSSEETHQKYSDQFEKISELKKQKLTLLFDELAQHIESTNQS